MGRGTLRYILSAAASIAVTAAAALGDTMQVDVFRAGEGGVHTYRIPAVAITPAGTLLVFCEARKEGIGDASPTDMVLRRSTDGGRTWLPIQTLVKGVGADAIMNPVAVADPQRGRILLLYCNTNRKERGEHRRHYLLSSRDDGRTWSRPRELGRRTAGYDDTFVPGPGAGIRMRNGRLIVPGYTAEEMPDFKNEKGLHSRVMYSDDGGRRWRMGEAVGIHANESQAVELEDGRLVLNMRQAMGESCRAEAFSSDGGARWDSIRYHRQLNEAPCQASVSRHSRISEDGRSLLLFANPDISGDSYAAAERMRMTVRLSRDEGATWPVKRLVHAGPSSYSGLIRFPDGDVGLVFEGGERHRREWIRLVRMPLSWLEGR